MLSDFIKRFRLSLFFLICLVIAWSTWIPQASKQLSNTQSPVAWSSPWNILAVWAPALSAILLLRITEGKSGSAALFQSFRHWRVCIELYLFILLYPAAIWFLARAIDFLVGLDFEFTIPILTYFPPELSYMVAVAILFAFPNALG